jgi:hypothetical protein
MMKKIIKHAAMTGLVSIAMATGAFAGGTATGVEPGAGCEAVGEAVLGKVNGAPYEGEATLIYDESNQRIDYSLTDAVQFGGTGTVSASGFVSFDGDFQAIKSQDIRQWCLNQIVEFVGDDSGTELAEVLAANRLSFNELDSNVATVEVLVVPLISQ